MQSSKTVDSPLTKITEAFNRYKLRVRLTKIKNKAKIFVGGGITEDSDPEKEWEEIINKSQTILEALFR